MPEHILRWNAPGLSSCKTPNCLAFAFGGCDRPTHRLPPYGSKRDSENGNGGGAMAQKHPCSSAPFASPIAESSSTSSSSSAAQVLVLMAVLVMALHPCGAGDYNYKPDARVRTVPYAKSIS